MQEYWGVGAVIREGKLTQMCFEIYILSFLDALASLDLKLSVGD